jgi:CubicO group peptidase (beta-lactamase class C family)
MPIVQGKVDELLARARRDVEEGVLPACQVALGYQGEVVAAATFGDATDDSRFCVFSATKGFVAGVVWQLIGDGLLDVTSTVAELVPGFGTNGKDVVTVEQVLLHTSGFPHAPLTHPEWASRERRLERFSSWRLNWEPGSRYEYHPTSAHWVLAEIIDRLTGGDYRQELHRRIVEPLGLRFELGVPPEHQGDLVRLHAVGELATPDELEAVLGVREVPLTEVTERALLGLDHPEVRAVGVPGGGGFGRAVDLARYYQALLHDPEGLWDPAVLADATGNVRNRLPEALTGIPACRSLGLMVAGDDGNGHLRGFGRTVSPRAFGHDGAGGQLAWADPVTGISLGYVTNGLDRHRIREARRSVALCSIAGDCATPTWVSGPARLG